MIFTYSVLKNSSNHWIRTVTELKEVEFPKIADMAGRRYALWYPQFGIPINELIMMFVWSDDRETDAVDVVNDSLQGLNSVVKVDTRLFAPTVRPLDDRPPEKNGLYVHRWMEIGLTDIDEAVALSKDAWITFENQFESRPIGLFREKREIDDATWLLLITWYQNFAAWEDSRNRSKEPKSWKNFARRHELTRESIGFATQILLD
ncbi:MAG: hypothetical protein GY866_18890 [Proteobacteria bacterium]|nr:hypothetical protein [Pseudomonadota bacterium]